MKCVICRKKLIKRQKICCSNRCVAKYANSKGRRKRKGWRISHGYRFIYHKDHKTKTKYVGEHTIVMNEFLGREVKKPEQVHHIDMDKLNNIIENLCLCKNESEHTKIHKSMERIVVELLKQGKVVFDKETKSYKLI